MQRKQQDAEKETGRMQRKQDDSGTDGYRMMHNAAKYQKIQKHCICTEVCRLQRNSANRILRKQQNATSGCCRIQQNTAQ
jgi:hypothetical protein